MTKEYTNLKIGKNSESITALLFAMILLIVLYVGTGLWLYFYDTVLEMYLEFGLSDGLVSRFKDYKYLIIIATLCNTALLFYLNRKRRKALFVSILLIIIQLMFMTYVIYADAFQCSCVTG